MEPQFLISGVDPNATDLGTLGGSSYARGINADGTIVGYSALHAFIVPAGGTIQRLMPADTESVASDINDAGQVAGDVYIAQGTQARGFVWTPGASPELLVLPPLPGGDQAQAFALNNAGIAVGVAQPQVGVFHAVLWDVSGAIQDLGTLGGTFAEAHDINNAGVVVGLSRNGAGAYRGFRWSAATGMEELPVLSAPGSGFASANAINSDGQIVGEMKVDSGPPHAVLWDTSGAIIDLDPLGTSQSAARAITEDGVIVGTRYLSSGSRVFAWDPDTHNPINVGAGNAEDVNAAGRIVGSLSSRATAWQLRLEQALTIALNADSARLPGSMSLARGIRPEIRCCYLVGRADPRIPGGRTSFSIRVANNGVPVSGYTLQVRAEFLPDSNGMLHLPSPWRFDSATVVGVNPNEPHPNTPVTGHFLYNGARYAILDIQPADSVVSGNLVAGYFGGEVRLIARALIGADTLADTVHVVVRVPDLVPDTAIHNALFVGWDISEPLRYPFGSNWFLTPAARDTLAAIVGSLSDPITGLYVQLNNASLQRGGMFRVERPPSTDPWVRSTPDHPHGHYSHTHGLDIDIGACYAYAHGVDSTQSDRISPNPGTTTCPSNAVGVPWRRVQQEATERAAYPIREGNHYHVRF